MRVVVGIILILATLFGASFYTQSALHQSAESMEKIIRKLENHVKEEDWKEANQIYTDLKKRWDEIEKGWNIIIDHQERDLIAMGLVRLEQYVKTENKSLSLGELGAVRELILHIPEKEKPTLINIF